MSSRCYSHRQRVEDDGSVTLKGVGMRIGLAGLACVLFVACGSGSGDEGAATVSRESDRGVVDAEFVTDAGEDSVEVVRTMEDVVEGVCRCADALPIDSEVGVHINEGPCALSEEDSKIMTSHNNSLHAKGVSPFEDPINMKMFECAGEVNRRIGLL